MKHYRWHITYEFGRVNEKYFIIVTDSVRCLANINSELFSFYHCSEYKTEKYKTSNDPVSRDMF